MPTSLEQQLSDIRAKIRQAEVARARAEAGGESAKNQVREATELLMEMGCKTLEEAKERMASLRKKLEADLEKVRQEL